MMIYVIFDISVRTIIAALHCNILIRKEDLVRNLDYVANVLEAVHQDETRQVLIFRTAITPKKEKLRHH